MTYHGGARVLVVDDSALTLEVIQRNLSAAGYDVYTAASVNQAIDLQEYIDFFQKEIISQYLTFHKGNISRTAVALGLSRQGLKNKMKKLQITPGD